MPKIDVNKNIFSRLYKGSIKRDKLEDMLPFAKAEWDGEDVDTLKIELNDTNRPDLWSAVGLARCLNGVLSAKVREYDFLSTPSKSKDTNGRRYIVSKDAPSDRPYSVGFCAKGFKLDDDTLKFLIQFQEKIHANYGRNRKSISMGLYRLADIKFPVTYTSEDKNKISFVPLNETQKMSGPEILEKTEKGKEFAHLLQDKERFPLLKDANGKVLSMPPIINSADVGALEVGDSEIFAEISGQYLDQVLLCANMIACDMADLGFEILPVQIECQNETDYGKTFVVPLYFQKEIKVKSEEIKKILSSSFRTISAPKALRKMGVNSKRIKPGFLSATIPAYRNDYLHPRDVVEDIAIGYGIERLGTEPIKDWTIGRLSNAEIKNRKIKQILTGLGFNEMIFNYLSSKKEYVDNMNIKGDEVLYIQNPMSENYRVVRPSIMPSLLKSESVSATAVYPHKIFECGKTCIKDAKAPDGVVTINSLGFLHSAADSNLNVAVSTLNVLMYYLNLDYKLLATDDPRFIKGRCANIIVGGKSVGIIGEVSLEVLANWSIEMPSVMAELNTDLMEVK